MTIDPFSDILHLVDATTVVSGGFTAGGAWAIRFPAPEKIKFCVVVKGGCWVSIDGEPAPVRAEAGDILLMVARRGFVLAGDLETPAVDAMAVFVPGAGGIGQVGSGDDFRQIGGHVQVNPVNGALLADVLPPWLHIRAAAPEANVLAWIVEQLVRERAADLPGAGMASTQLAQLMFTHILRLHLDSAGALAGGWLRGLGDRRIAPVLRLLHGEPGRPWQLGELAHAAAMSRTSFAVHFKAVVGVAPLAYLTGWRMRLAERALREENTPVAVLAWSLGYTSESAFSNAFKRATGHAPKKYRASVRAVSQQHQAAKPPSISRSPPVTKPASGPAR